MKFELNIEDLIGKIKPIGETNIDNERLENIEKYDLLATYLIEKIYQAATYKDDELYSRSKVGGQAFKVLCDLKTQIEDDLKLLITEDE